jgi:hypothetical protein
MDRKKECSSFTWTLTWDCTNNWRNTLGAWEKWVLPAWVKLDWTFMEFKCWGLWPFPNSSDCKKWCAVWYIFDSSTNSCIATSWICSEHAFEAWDYLEDSEWDEGHNFNWKCLPYCIPWHSVNCIVKE